MRKMILMALTLGLGLISTNSFAQCGISGLGTNGSIVPCGQTETYFANCCQGGSWSWKLDNSFIVDANTPPGTTFNFGNVSGTIVTATAGTITINWDCPTNCNAPSLVITEISQCGFDFFNPTIRIMCPPDDDPPGPCFTIQHPDCDWLCMDRCLEVSTTCEQRCVCILVKLADGTISHHVVMVTNDNPVLLCFDEEIVSYTGQLTDCPDCSKGKGNVDDSPMKQEGETSKESLQQNLQVFPNPNREGSVQTRFESETNATVQVKVYTITGKLVYDQQHQVVAGSNQLDIRCENCLQGGTPHQLVLLDEKGQLIGRHSVTFVR